jgi:hypothetical protein
MLPGQLDKENWLLNSSTYQVLYPLSCTSANRNKLSGLEVSKRKCGNATVESVRLIPAARLEKIRSATLIQHLLPAGTIKWQWTIRSLLTPWSGGQILRGYE